jgi:hypothetical protein
VWVDGVAMAGDGDSDWKTGQNSAHEFDITERVEPGHPFLLAVAVTNKANYTLGDCIGECRRPPLPLSCAETAPGHPRGLLLSWCLACFSPRL